MKTDIESPLISPAFQERCGGETVDCELSPSWKLVFAALAFMGLGAVIALMAVHSRIIHERTKALFSHDHKHVFGANGPGTAAGIVLAAFMACAVLLLLALRLRRTKAPPRPPPAPPQLLASQNREQERRGDENAARSREGTTISVGSKSSAHAIGSSAGVSFGMWSSESEVSRQAEPGGAGERVLA